MPPLWIWTLLAVISLGGVALLYRMATDIRENEYRVRAEYLRQPVDTEEGRPYILFLGSSLTQCGIDSVSFIEEELRRYLGRKTVVRKLWRRATSLETLSSICLESGAPPPDLLVVEANMLFYSANPPTPAYELSSALRQLRKKNRRGSRYDPDNRPAFKSYDPAPLDDFRGSPADINQLTSFVQLVQTLEKKRTKIVLLNFPLEKTTDSIKWASNQTANYKRNVRLLQNSASVGILHLDVKMDSTYFIDRGHMNPAGARRFSRLLCAELAKRTATQ